MSESELDDLMGEVGGPCTFQGMVDMFQKQMAGDGNDPDEIIIQAFSAYDKEGLGLFVAVKEEEKKVEEKKEEVVEEAPEEDGDAKKKKKKKKKAAK